MIKIIQAIGLFIGCASFLQGAVSDVDLFANMYQQLDAETDSTKKEKLQQEINLLAQKLKNAEESDAFLQAEEPQKLEVKDLCGEKAPREQLYTELKLVEEKFLFFQQHLCIKDLLPSELHIQYDELMYFFSSRINVLKQLWQIESMADQDLDQEKIFQAKTTVLLQSFDVMISIHGAITHLLLSLNLSTDPFDLVLQVQRLCLDAYTLVIQDRHEAFNRSDAHAWGQGESLYRACAAKFVYQVIPKNIKGSLFVRLFERVVKLGMNTKIFSLLLKNPYGPHDQFYAQYAQVASCYGLRRVRGIDGRDGELNDSINDLISLLQNMHINYGDTGDGRENPMLFAATQKLRRHILAIKHDLDLHDSFSIDYAKDAEKRLVAIIYVDLIKNKDFTKIINDHTLHGVAQQYQTSLNIFLLTYDYSCDLLCTLCKIEYDLQNIAVRCARSGLASLLFGQTPAGLILNKMLQSTQIAIAQVQSKISPDSKGFFGRLLTGDWSEAQAPVQPKPGLVAQWAGKLFGTKFHDNQSAALHAVGRVSPLAIMAVLKCAAPYMTQSLRENVVYFLTGVERKSKQEQENALATFLTGNPELIAQLCEDNPSLKQVLLQYVKDAS